MVAAAGLLARNEALDKQRYLEEAGSKVTVVRERVSRLKMQLAETVNRSDQLQKAQQQVDALVLALTEQLERLHLDDEHGWPEELRKFEHTWDNLIDSVKNLIARFTD